MYKGSLAVFPGSMSGLILRPDERSMKLLCSYSGDAGTANKVCTSPGGGGRRLGGGGGRRLGGGGDCVPGCTQDGRDPGRWCDPNRALDDGGYCQGRPFRPEHLGSMLNAHRSTPYVYNELVFDPATWAANLPLAIEAFFYLSKTPPDTARAAQQDFARAFPDAATTPLVRLDLRNKEAPFSEA